MKHTRNYYEVVFEGNSRAVFALLEGYMLGKGKKWVFFFSRSAGIKTETLTEAIVEWITLQNRIHHVIIEEEMYKSFTKDLSSRSDLRISSPRYVRSVKPVKNAWFRFSVRAYGKKYGNEIKAMLQHLPQGLELHEYSPMEKERPDTVSTEQYTTEQDYVFEATGKISGDLAQMIEFRKILFDHPLVDVKEIKIRF